MASSATGPWSGHDGAVAQFDGTAWIFYAPKAGWTAWVVDEADTVVHDGTAWRGGAQRNLLVQELGVSATPDAQNRLSVSSPATLLNHAGAGHQLKLNKAAVADTASVLFQTGFSGRAEMGLAGNDGFGVKSSADGAAWVDALFIPSTGRPQLPQGVTVAPGTMAAPSVAFQGAAGTGAFLTGGGDIGLSVGGVQRASLGTAGLRVDGVITGTAVTQGPADSTSDRLMKTGDFGLGSTSTLYGVASTPTGLADVDSTQFFVHGSGAAPGDAPAATQAAGLKVGAGSTWNATLWASLFTNRWYARTAASSGGLTPWTELLTLARVAGPVSQSAGVPTGALIERASNANGTYMRFADGTQICTHSLAASASAAVNWTYPAAFAVAPSVTGSVQATVLSAHCLDAAPGLTSSAFSARDKADARRADTCRLMAIGRWF